LERIDAESLFKMHASFIASFLLRLGVARADLDDMVQEVFLLAHRKGGYMPGPAKPRTWLCAIAVRMARQGRRVASTRRVRLDEQAVLDAASDSGDPAHAFEMQESLSRVRLALESLDLEHRLAFLLYEVEGESCPEIAAVAGVPVGTIYSRLHHARRRFHAAYAELPERPVLPQPPPLLPQPAIGRESFPPLRLHADAAAPDSLRGDLRRIAAIGLLDFDSIGGLQHLRDALAKVPSSGAPSATPGAAHPAAQAGWMQQHGALLRAAARRLPAGRALLVIGASTVLLGAPDTDRSSRIALDIADGSVDLAAQAGGLSRHARRLSRAPAGASRGNALRREIEELGRIHALVNVDPARAYRLTQSSDQQFQAGTMAQERQALAVLALWNGGQREAAARKASAFIARYPHGPMRERILQVLHEASP
jgi:RNA polymerase sigma-70 factor (ECF subfamily)